MLRISFKSDRAMAQTLAHHPDNVQIHSHRTWEQFKHLQNGYEGSPGVRLSFFEGIVEVLVLGQDHEIFSHVIGWLLTTFLAFKGIPFVATGAADQEKAGIAATQPDQSYCLGSRKPIPDLSIEVIFTSGGIKKLARYQALGVPEVWFWEDGTLALYHLRLNGYERIDRSELDGLKDLDLDLLKRCILLGETDLGEAVRVFMGAIALLNG
jgi:Uma2 family endonuclease